MENSTKIITATAVGVVVGGVIGLLFAPEKGEDTRKDISQKGKTFFQKINDQMSKEKLSELKQEFETQLEKINEKIKGFTNPA